ncbi:MAG: hypothetical protein LBT80_07290 [Lactobacillaceae bacterium]|jgi:hypothetical protein|nr:hypothetical protein [Lactobacillaceae bacterium]
MRRIHAILLAALAILVVVGGIAYHEFNPSKHTASFASQQTSHVKINSNRQFSFKFNTNAQAVDAQIALGRIDTMKMQKLPAGKNTTDYTIVGSLPKGVKAAQIEFILKADNKDDLTKHISIGEH